MPRYGFHLSEKRLATHGFRLDFTPDSVADWGIAGTLIGRKLNSYWSVPALEIAGPKPSILGLNHMALSMASYGSIAMFHVIGQTPEAPDWETAGGGRQFDPEQITCTDLDNFYKEWGGLGDKLDVVALSTPQLDIPEIVRIAERLEDRKVHPDTTFLVYTPIEIKQACARIGLVETVEKAGGRVVHGHDFFAAFAKEIREAHGWSRLITHSVKMVNICEGYGYKQTPASIDLCIESAVSGKVLP